MDPDGSKRLQQDVLAWNAEQLVPLLARDVGEWDRASATSAPGQSEWPLSPHFADLAKLWAAGEYFPLMFSEAAVIANAESTLTLAPPR